MNDATKKETASSTLAVCLERILEQEACIAVLRADLLQARQRYETITTSLPWRAARLVRRLLAAVLPAGTVEVLINAFFPAHRGWGGRLARPGRVPPAVSDTPSTWDAIVLAAGEEPDGGSDPAAVLVAAGHRVYRVSPRPVPAAAGTAPRILDLVAPIDVAAAGALVNFFEKLCAERSIIEAAVLVQDPARQPLAKALARDRGWPMLDPVILERTPVAALETAWPLVSIIVVTYNNLAYTRLCLESLLRHRGYPRFEILVVDNASIDETPAYLQGMAAAHPEISIILNSANLGFAAANNQGLSQAQGNRLVLLNNDTIVPRGWLTRLTRHLEDPRVGLAGPVTNSIGNEARISVSYTDPLGMPAFVEDHYAAHPQPESFDIRVLAMYCVAMRRDAFEKIGPLDEIFGVGMFEDDDYAHRARLAGYRVVCCEDVFIHHFGETSFNKLKTDGRYRALFEENRAKFEKKWGVAWVPHAYRR